MPGVGPVVARGLHDRRRAASRLGRPAPQPVTAAVPAPADATRAEPAAGARSRRPVTPRAPAARRTPAASSAASAADRVDAGGGVLGVEQQLTNAEPTMTASAKPATAAAWSPSRTPSPTPTGESVPARPRATSSGAALLVASRAPVTPITEVA